MFYKIYELNLWIKLLKAYLILFWYNITAHFRPWKDLSIQLGLDSSPQKKQFMNPAPSYA